MVTPPRAAIEDATGDGTVISLLPGALRARLRRKLLRRARFQERRLQRVGRAVLPVLHFIEQVAFPADRRLLDGRSFEEICHDSRAIERGLTLFDVAWQAGLINIRAEPGGPLLAAGDVYTVVGACGLSVADAQHYYLMMTVALIFADNPKTLEKLRHFVTDRRSLPRMRSLATFNEACIEEMQGGWGRRFAELLTVKDKAFVDAVKTLQVFHWRGLRASMGKHFIRTIDWAPEMFDAIALNFAYPDQLRDLGDNILLLNAADKLRAVGSWEARTTADGTVETDVGGIRRALGQLFGVLLERDAVVIATFGQIYSELRHLDGTEKALATEQFMTLAKRFMPYLTGPSLQALLTPVTEGAAPLNLAELNGVLEGLWRKEFFGQNFFENGFKQPEAAVALANLVKAYVTMKGSGVAKTGNEATALIANSDLFDRHIARLGRRKPMGQSFSR